MEDRHTDAEYKKVISILQDLRQKHPELEEDIDIAIMCVDCRNRLENYIGKMIRLRSKSNACNVMQKML